MGDARARRVAVAVALTTAIGGAAACGVKDRGQASLELAPATITVAQKDGAQHVLALAADGAVTWDGRPLATVGKDGKLRVGGQVVGTIDHKGALLQGGQPTNLAVLKDGTFLDSGAPELTIDRDGSMAGPLIDSLDSTAFDPAGGTLRYSGPSGARQATMLGFLAIAIPALAPPPPAR